MSKKDKALAGRARAAGLRWDDGRRRWVGRLQWNDETLQFTLNGQALVRWLDDPKQPLEQAP